MAFAPVSTFISFVGCLGLICSSSSGKNTIGRCSRPMTCSHRKESGELFIEICTCFLASHFVQSGLYVKIRLCSNSFPVPYHVTLLTNVGRIGMYEGCHYGSRQAVR